jgi:hypothetical protein
MPYIDTCDVIDAVDVTHERCERLHRLERWYIIDVDIVIVSLCCYGIVDVIETGGIILVLTMFLSMI